MKTLLLIFICLFSTAFCFAQEGDSPDAYCLNRKCPDKIKVYQSVNNKPDLAHFKYMSYKYWFVKANQAAVQSDSDYVKIFIPDDEVVEEAKSPWATDGQLVSQADYNTWLYISKSDLKKFQAFALSRYNINTTYQQLMAQGTRH